MKFQSIIPHGFFFWTKVHLKVNQERGRRPESLLVFSGRAVGLKLPRKEGFPTFLGHEG